MAINGLIFFDRFWPKWDSLYNLISVVSTRTRNQFICVQVVLNLTNKNHSNKLENFSLRFKTFKNRKDAFCWRHVLLFMNTKITCFETKCIYICKYYIAYTNAYIMSWSWIHWTAKPLYKLMKASLDTKITCFDTKCIYYELELNPLKDLNFHANM